jgi:hypothetical protein
MREIKFRIWDNDKKGLHSGENYENPELLNVKQ